MRKIDALESGRRDGFPDVGLGVVGWREHFDLARFRIDAGPARESRFRIPKLSIAADALRD